MAQGSLKRLAAVAALVTLAACATPAPPPPAPAPARPPPVVAPAPAPAPPPVAAAPAPAPQPADACGATPLQYLVGRPHTEIPVPVYPARRRVLCSTCVMTQDVVSWRQTIVYDARSGLVTSVKCG